MSKPDEKNPKANENAGQSNDNYIDFRNIKPGDYEVHIYLEETRGLVHPTDSSSTVDPIIKMKVFDQSKSTKYKSNRGTGMIYWGEHIFFDKKITEGEEFQLEKLFIQVFDYNLIGENALIGQFELDLSSIYFNSDRSILHKWVALSNYKSKMEEIKGFLKFSVNIVGPGDKQIELDDEKPEKCHDENLFKNSGKGNMNASNVLLPPQIQTKGWQMKVQLIKAEHLIKMDWGGNIDCYLVFQFGNAQFITEIIKDTVNPFWGKAIFIPYSEPTVNENLIIKVFDWDRASNDEIVGSTSFKKQEIAEGKRKNFFWLNIYGAQPDGDEKSSKIMNSNPDLGSFWKGRILLSLSSVPEEHPKLDSTNLTPQIIEQFKKSDNLEWMIAAEIYFGLSFPNNDDKYSIQVRWADMELNFDKNKTHTGIWEWYSRKSLTCSFPYLSFDELPDVIIYVCSGDDRISYVRYPAKYFQNLNGKPKFFYFKPDRSKSPKMRDDQAGIVKMRLAISLKTAFSDGSWSKPIAKPNNKIGYLFAYIYHAQELLPADSDGTSDPYFKLNYCGVEIKSEAIQDTLNPIWNQTYQMQVPLMRPEDSPPLILRMYDEDVTSDEFIGSVYINIQEAVNDGSIIFNKSEKPKPKWFNLKFNKTSKSGKILACFNIFENKPLNWNPKIISDYEKYYVKMRILGLRDLKSMGIFPVKKAFIKFDLNSLRSKEQRHDLQEKKAILTQPNYPGPDPNISTIISFEIFLPKDTTLWPFMNCIVYDSILKGFIQPVLGSFSINLEDLYIKTKNRMDRKFKKIAEAFARNQNILSGVKLDSKALINQQNPPLDQSKPPAQKNQFFDLEIGKSKNDYRILEEEKSVNISPMKSLQQSANVTQKINVIQENGIINSDSIVLKAKYEFNTKTKQYLEVDIPDPNFFFPLGHDSKDKRSKAENIKKHYRYFVDSPLENSPFIDKFTFDEFDIMRGSRVNHDSVFLELIGFDQTEKKVGKFKGWIDVISETEKNKVENHKATFLAKAFFENRAPTNNDVKGKKKLNFDQEFIDKTQVIVRVYIINAVSLPQMDDNSLSDPYIEVKLGKEKKNNKDNYLKDVANADFYTMFELRTTLPGSSQLEINVWDYDELVRDDLIGQTIIDLENRFFSKKWRKLTYAPIETRNLYSPLSSLNRGRIKLWVEIIPIREMALVKQIWDIQPKPPSEYELRVIVWECSGVPSSDIEDTSDLYVTGRIGENIQKTDIHYRSQDGNGHFNWRMVFPIKLPLKDPNITFQIYDKDILSIDDFISEATLNFQQLSDEAFENDSIVKMNQKHSAVAQAKKSVSQAFGNLENDFSQKSNDQKNEEEKKSSNVPSKEKIEIMLQNAKKEGYSSMKDVGTLIISFELIPNSMAKNNPVGLGRNEPNHSPWLPPPANRFSWSWNPWTLFKSLVGPAARTKILLCLCVLICCVFLIILIPNVFGSLIGTWIA